MPEYKFALTIKGMLRESFAVLAKMPLFSFGVCLIGIILSAMCRMLFPPGAGSFLTAICDGVVQIIIAREALGVLGDAKRQSTADIAAMFISATRNGPDALFDYFMEKVKLNKEDAKLLTPAVLLNGFVVLLAFILADEAEGWISLAFNMIQMSDFGQDIKILYPLIPYLRYIFLEILIILCYYARFFIVACDDERTGLGNSISHVVKLTAGYRWRIFRVFCAVHIISCALREFFIGARLLAGIVGLIQAAFTQVMIAVLYFTLKRAYSEGYVERRDERNGGYNPQKYERYVKY